MNEQLCETDVLMLFALSTSLASPGGVFVHSYVAANDANDAKTTPFRASMYY